MAADPKLGANRRSILQGAIAAAGAAAFPMPSLAQSNKGEVVFAGYGGTLEQLTSGEILPAFEKATGIKARLVIGTALSNYSKVLASRNNPEIDVYWSNELTHTGGKQLGLYEKLDTSVVKSLPDILDVARDPDGIGVASYIIATGIQYNSAAYAKAGLPPPSSWYDLWDPRLKGKVALYSFSVAYSQDLICILTRLAGGTEKDIRPGLEKVKQLKAIGNLTAFASSPAELDNMLIQEQAWATVNGSPRGFVLKERGAPIDFAFPKEGAGFFTNYFDVVKNARNSQNAQILVDYLTSPEAQLILAKGAVAAPINRKVSIPPSLAAQVPNEERLKHMIRIDRAEMNRQLDNWAELWNREVEGRG
jgi:putative spermidine/putrescine transport system substrate-binding protein